MHVLGQEHNIWKGHFIDNNCIFQSFQIFSLGALSKASQR